MSDALDAGWIGMGPLTQQFEAQIGSYLGNAARHVVSTNSGTAALHLAALSAGLGPGDEVICPSFTYVAGHQAMTQTGADVAFCDIEETTLGVDPASMRSMISERTKALMAVHYAGIVCRIDEIYELAAEHDLRVIEDAAHAFGSSHNGRLIGSFGDYVCFSYGPVKIITTLEGGAVVTGDASEVQPLHELRLIGVDNDTAARYARGRAWEYDVTRQGYRYHLGSIPAAIGISQLAMIDTFITNRQGYCRRYNEALGDLDEIRTPTTDFNDVSPFIYFIRVADGETRADLMAHMKSRGVATGIHFQGAHEFTFYKDCRSSDLSVTELMAQQQLTIPLHSFMDDQTLDRVVDAIRSFFV